MEPAFVRRFGLRKAVVWGAAVMCAGCFLRACATEMSQAEGSWAQSVRDVRGPAWVAVAGTMFVGAAQPLFQCTPSLLAANWFGENETTFAVTMALNANQLGIAASYAVGAGLVHSDLALLRYFRVLFVVSFFLAVGASVHFRERPVTPPSYSALASLKREVRKEERKDTAERMQRASDVIGDAMISDSTSMKSNNSSSRLSSKRRTSHKKKQKKLHDEEDQKQQEGEELRSSFGSSTSSFLCDAVEAANHDDEEAPPPSIKEKRRSLESPMFSETKKKHLLSKTKDGEDAGIALPLRRTSSKKTNNDDGDDSPTSSRHLSVSSTNRSSFLNGMDSDSDEDSEEDEEGRDRLSPLVDHRRFLRPPGRVQRNTSSVESETPVCEFLPAFLLPFSEAAKVVPTPKPLKKYVRRWLVISHRVGHGALDATHDLFSSTKSLMQLPGFVACLVAFVASIVVSNVFSTFLPHLIATAKLTTKERNATTNARVACLGAMFQFMIMFGSLAFGAVVDSTKAYKKALQAAFFGSVVALAAIASSGVVDYDLDAAVLLLGACVGPVQPLAAELAVETTYPDGDENHIVAIQQTFGNCASALAVPAFHALSVYAANQHFTLIRLDYATLAACTLLAALFFRFSKGYQAPLKRTATNMVAHHLLAGSNTLSGDKPRSKYMSA